MTRRNSLFIVFASILSTPHGYAMLCRTSSVQRCAARARHMFTVVNPHTRTVKDVYNDALNIGDSAYSHVNKCREKGCTRFVQKCDTGEDYMRKIERRFLSLPYPGVSSLEGNLKTHVATLKEQFHQLCSLEKETLFFMLQAKETATWNIASTELNHPFITLIGSIVDNVDLYKKTLALTTNKKRSIRKQVETIEISLLDRFVSFQEMEKANVVPFKILYAGKEVPAEFELLCSDFVSWQNNPANMIVYNESEDKE